MSKAALTNLQDIVELLADEIGDGTLIIERGTGKDYALISKDYLETLERKADAYDQMTQSPEDREAEQAAMNRKMDQIGFDGN